MKYIQISKTSTLWEIKAQNSSKPHTPPSYEITIAHNTVFHLSAAALANTSPYIPTGLPNIHIRGPTQIIDTLPDRRQVIRERAESSLSLPFTPVQFKRLRVQLINLLLQTCYKYAWAATSLLRILPCKIFLGTCWTAVYRNLSRYVKIQKKLARQEEMFHFTLRKHCLGLIFVSHLPKSSWT